MIVHSEMGAQNIGVIYFACCLAAYVQGECPKCVDKSWSRHVETYASSCFDLSNSPKDHQGSEQDCATMGGLLALIKDTATQSFIGDHIKQHANVSHWVGLKAPVSPFLYTDWSVVQEQNLWAPNQPPTFCVYMDSDADYKFSVADCSEQHEFVCQSDIVDCRQNDCENGGSCTSCFKDTHKMCDCLPGYTGSRCATDIDDCASAPCLNGGVCLDGVNNYTCQCFHGFDGVNCAHDIDLCDPNPCPFNWDCTETVGGGLSCSDPRHANRIGSDQAGFGCTASSCPTGMTCRSGGPGLYSCTL
ncbi:uncharacterized protein LOC144861349 [Branchiostoma floridae x Branchiostoma japonicum]